VPPRWCRKRWSPHDARLARADPRRRPDRARAQAIRQTRVARYRTLRGFFHGDDDLTADGAATDEPRLHSILLAEGAHAVGRTLGELALQALGVEVTAVRRRNIRALEPAAETRFRSGDVVVLLGSPAALAAAEQRLLQG
jgi:CPA2 family monovalent cation:H+ antiporter-2